MCLKMSHWGSPLLTWDDCQFQEWSIPTQMPPSQWEQSSSRELEWKVNTCGRLTYDTKYWQARIKNGSCEQRIWKTSLPLNIYFQSPISIGKTHYKFKKAKKKSLQSFWQVKITFTNNLLTIKWQKYINHRGLYVYSLDYSLSKIPWIINLLR